MEDIDSVDIFENNNLINKIFVKRNATLEANNSRSSIIPSINFNSTDDNSFLQNTVLYPLQDIVQEKEKEVTKLISIKENLITYLKSNTNASIHNIINGSNVTENCSLHSHQLKVPPEANFRRSNLNMLEKYIAKLKRDIYEVIQDIARIQRLSNSNKMPLDLKILIKALKYYINNQKRKQNNESKIKVNLRRNFNMNINVEKDPIDALSNVLEVLDKDMPDADALTPLTRHTRNILKRIIEHFAIEDPVNKISNILDPNNNIENYLNNIGLKWRDMTIDVGKNEISERIYSLKLFHLTLSKDIIALQKTIEIVEFAQSRRMSVIDDYVGERIISKIGNKLHKINGRVKQIIQFQRVDRNTTRSNHKVTTEANRRDRKSLFQRIKKLMKHSKKDIIGLIRKINTSEVMKRIARRKMEEQINKNFLEYEDTIQKWQKNFNVAPRIKRDGSTKYFDNFVNRIKSIIPGYLKKKVRAVDRQRNKNKTSNNQNKGRNNKITTLTDSKLKKLTKKNTSTTTIDHTSVYK